MYPKTVDQMRQRLTRISLMRGGRWLARTGGAEGGGGWLRLRAATVGVGLAALPRLGGAPLRREGSCMGSGLRLG
jgi:hypothetical protein